MTNAKVGRESGKTVTRADLSEIVYQKIGLSRTESAELVQSVLDEICDAAARGETVKLSGFGSFVVRSKGRAGGAQSEDRGRGADPSSPGDGVQAVQRAEGQDQRARRVRKGVGRSRERARLAFPSRSADSGSSPDGGAIDSLAAGAANAPMEKSPEAYRTIREVADSLDLPQHVLRFWETRFPQIRPLKRAGGRRYYRPDDIERLRLIKRLLYEEGYTIKGVQKLFKEQGVQALSAGRSPCPLESPRRSGGRHRASAASGLDASPGCERPMRSSRTTRSRRCAKRWPKSRTPNESSRKRARRVP